MRHMTIRILERENGTVHYRHQRDGGRETYLQQSEEDFADYIKALEGYGYTITIKENGMSKFREALTVIAWLAVITIGLAWALGGALDKSAANKEQMLCNSAKVSGNVEYLNKCK